MTYTKVIAQTTHTRRGSSSAEFFTAAQKARRQDLASQASALQEKADQALLVLDLIEDIQVALKQKDYDTALQFCKDLLLFIPGDIKTFETCAHIHELLGQPHKAELFLKKILDSHPNRPNVWNNLGLLYLEEEMYTLALSCFENAIWINRYNEDFWFNKGITLLCMHDPYRAIVCFQKAVDLNPQYDKAKAKLDDCQSTKAIIEEEFEQADQLGWIQ